MSEKTYCEKCGSEMKVINENHPDGMTCQNCGWGWVTSYFEPILSDTYDYHIILLPCENSLLAIKTVSEIANCNYIDAKK